MSFYPFDRVPQHFADRVAAVETFIYIFLFFALVPQRNYSINFFSTGFRLAFQHLTSRKWLRVYQRFSVSNAVNYAQEIILLEKTA